MLINLPVSEHVLNFWVQTSSFGGKIADTDAYVYIDLLAEDFGFDIHTYEHIHHYREKIILDDEYHMDFEYSYTGPHSLQNAFTNFALVNFGMFL